MLALLLISLTKPTAADHFYVDINTLHGWCRPYEVGSESIGSLCEGYINAIADILAHGLSIHDNRACIPAYVELVDLRDVVIEALKDAPRTDSKVAHDWVARAISEAFPCGSAGN
ncbi:MAG: Rap1a/Tai family immunity protein [Paracoccaceae bacterium]